MSRLKAKNSLLSGHSRTSHSASAQDEINSLKYVLERPRSNVYSLDDLIQPYIYPDFQPWENQDDPDVKLNNMTALNKGYFEGPKVPNEHYSARNLIQETLLTSPENCASILKELSQHFTSVYRTRVEVINRIRHESHDFKPPPRVTLTASKKEAWLKDLADPDVPLLKCATKIPHGIRNRALIETMCNMNVPMHKAIWFTKCTLFSESLLLRRKFQNRGQSPQPVLNVATLDTLEIRWLQEWTQQIADHILKFSREMDLVDTVEKKAQFHSRLNYLISYVLTLYIECLIDRLYFLSSLMILLRDNMPFEPLDVLNLLELAHSDDDEGEALQTLLGERRINVGQILVALLMLKIFWKDVLKDDTVCKDVAGLLLLTHFLVEKATSVFSPSSQPIRSGIIDQIKIFVTGLFRHNTNVFIIPNFWSVICDLLVETIMSDQELVSDLSEAQVREDLQLIHYRNESLVLNMKFLARDERSLRERRSSIIENSFMREALENSASTFADHTHINRPSGDHLHFVEQLDKLKFDSRLAQQLTLRYNQDDNTWRGKLKILIYWCVFRHTNLRDSQENILIACNFLNKRIIKTLTGRGSAMMKAEFEGELLDIIFSLSEEPHLKECLHALYVLMNELYQLQILSISTFLRKLIACGLFYESDDTTNNSQREFYLSLLRNLPVQNNKQCDHILKKFSPEAVNFSVQFEEGVSILQESFLSRFNSNSVDSSYEACLKRITELHVGVQFLLLNWLTTQIKETISESPKLIHMTPVLITKTYRFYAACNNLTVFFKTFVRFVLRNENKVLIYFLESVYLIAKLLIHHFVLVRNLAPASRGAVPPTYELFRLIITNYKDMRGRENETFSFRDIWLFFQQSVEKSSGKDVKADARATKTKLESLLHGKDTVESPIPIHHNTRLGEQYTPAFFREELSALLSITEESMLMTEIQELRDEYGKLPELSPESFVDIEQVHNILRIAFESYRVHQDSLSENQEIAAAKLMHFLLRQLRKSDKPHNFGDLFFQGLSGEVSAGGFSDNTMVCILKLVSFEVISLSNIFELIDSFKPTFSESTLVQIYADILFGKPNFDHLLNDAQRALLSIARKNFTRKFIKTVFALCMKFFTSQELFTLESCAYKDAMLESIRTAYIHQNRWVSHNMLQEVLGDIVLSVGSELLGQPGLFNNMTTVEEIVPYLDEFTLIILQSVAAVLMRRTPVTEENVSTTIVQLLNKLKSGLQLGSSPFSELFVYVDWSQKLTIFNYMTTLFLRETKFARHDDEITATLKVGEKQTDVIFVARDFFRKFSVSSTSNIGSTLETFQDFKAFLLSILEIVGQVECPTIDGQCEGAIFAFLRLLVIHEDSFTTVMVSHDQPHFEFAAQLMELLQSNFFLNESFAKMRILLYDLLLIMKTSLSRKLAVVAETPTDEKKEDSEKPVIDETASQMVATILDLPDHVSSTLTTRVSEQGDAALTLDDDELYHESDFNMVNNQGWHLIARQRKSITTFDMQPQALKPFHIKSMCLIENTGTNLNDGCVNLLYFGAYVTKENPQ